MVVTTCPNVVFSQQNMIKMKIIEQTYFINAPIEKVWQALVDPKVIEAWGGGPAEMNDMPGTKFKLWGGEVFGTNLEVITNKKLVQEWYGGEWDYPSKVTFILISEGDSTELELTHEDVPEKEVDEINDGWSQYYLGPIKELLEK